MNYGFWNFVEDEVYWRKLNIFCEIKSVRLENEQQEWEAGIQNTKKGKQNRLFWQFFLTNWWVWKYYNEKQTHLQSYHILIVGSDDYKSLWKIASKYISRTVHWEYRN